MRYSFIHSFIPRSIVDGDVLIEIFVMAGSSRDVAAQRLLANQPAVLLSKRSLPHGDVRPRHRVAADVCCSDGRRQFPAGVAAPLQPEQLGRPGFRRAAAVAPQAAAAVEEGQPRRGFSPAHDVHRRGVSPHDHSPRFGAVHSRHRKRTHLLSFNIILIFSKKMSISILIETDEIDFIVGWRRWMPKSRSVASAVCGAARARGTEPSPAGRRTSRNRFGEGGRPGGRLPQTSSRHRSRWVFAEARVLRRLQRLPLPLQPRRPVALGGQCAQDPAWPQRRELLPSTCAYSSGATSARFSFSPQLLLDNAFNQPGRDSNRPRVFMESTSHFNWNTWRCVNHAGAGEDVRSEVKDLLGGSTAGGAPSNGTGPSRGRG